jgi:hypothetical protein
MKKKEDFHLLICYVYPMLELFKIAGNIKEFESWMQSEHEKKLDNEIFHGYKFFLECAFSNILSSLIGDSSLDIKGDLLIESVGRERFPLLKIPNTSERAIFAKNVFSHYKKIQQSKDFQSFIPAYKNFNEKVVVPLDVLFKNNIRINKKTKLSEEKINNLFLLERLYIQFNQIGNDGPYAHDGTYNKSFIPDKKLEKCFEGYKYTVQFLWYKLLGSEQYYSSCLSKLHETTEWRGYKYEKELTKEEEEDSIASLFRPYDLYKQTSFDAFFERIRDEYMYPLEERLKINILQIDKFYDTSIKHYSREIFNGLFDVSLAPQEQPTIEEEIDMTLLWIQAEIIEPEFNNSIPHFITLLHGVASLLRKKEKEFEKVMICKFIHPLEKPDDYDYSYGIIVDSKAAAGYPNSEWLIYYDCCSNTSGYANGQHQRVEKAIKKFLDKDKVIVREFTIGHREFKKYISRYIREQAERSDNSSHISESDSEDKMNRIEERKRHQNIIRDSQGILLELVSYYLVTRKSEYSKYKDIEWNINADEGEIDILLTNDTDVHIIECKLNPKTIDINKEINKLHKKLDDKLYNSKINKDVEFWFWYKPTEITIEILREKDINYQCLCENGFVTSDTLKKIFNFNTNF